MIARIRAKWGALLARFDAPGESGAPSPGDMLDLALLNAAVTAPLWPGTAGMPPAAWLFTLATALLAVRLLYQRRGMSSRPRPPKRRPVLNDRCGPGYERRPKTDTRTEDDG